MIVREMTDEEHIAIDGLLNGDLSALADLMLAEQEERHPLIHPIVHRYILTAIRGTSDETDYRLVLSKHPDLATLRQGNRAKQKTYLRSLEIANLVAANAVIKDGAWKNVEAAVAQVMAEKGLGRSTVMDHWSEHNAFLLHWAMKASDTAQAD